MHRAVNLSLWTIMALVLAACAAQSNAATMIEYLGIDQTTLAAWRSTSVAKDATYDVNHDNAYGSDGYYVAYRNSEGAPASIYSSLPTYIDSVTPWRADTTYAAPAYGALNNPSLPIASTVANLDATGAWEAYSRNQYDDYFTITLKEDATFVLTNIVGTENKMYWNTDQVKITGSDATTVESPSYGGGAGLPPSAAAYVFFSLSGKAGDTFTVSMFSAYSGSVSSGIAFETVPEPSVAVLLASGLLACAWRKRK